MVGLVLERVPVPGVPDILRVEVGEQRAVVVPDPDQARRLADLVGGLTERPAGTTVRVGGMIRLVPAEGGLLPYLTVLGNLVHGGRAAHRFTQRAAAEEGCRAVGSRCGLDDVLDRYPHEITPGRRRLAGLARALCARPTAIVLEDAAGLPTWGALLDLDHNPELLSAALLLITPERGRALGFEEVNGA
ncbi:MAG TPA: hypothetical protein VLJ59_17920 [Mycobacteriales bacterium]|nr:hypothetical protein [Mycobacteriales bacterium]